MKRNALLTLACCLAMGIVALMAPSRAMAMPYHATDSELRGTAYAVLNWMTGELDFVRSTETHADKSIGIVTSINGGTYIGTIYTGFEALSDWSTPTFNSYFVRSSVKSVRFVDAVRPKATCQWFYGMKNCTTMDLSKLDTSQVTDMHSMFELCNALTSLDVSTFDTSKVANMDSMFYNCSKLTSLDLSSFDTGRVTDMGSMFDDCSSLTSLDVSTFDTSKVANMGWMFQFCSSLSSLDLSSFDTVNVTTMTCMFDKCSHLTSIDVSSFDTSQAMYMGAVFRDCSSLTSLDLSSFDTSQAMYMDNMFNGCTSLNKITFGDKFVVN